MDSGCLNGTTTSIKNKNNSRKMLRHASAVGEQIQEPGISRIPSVGGEMPCEPGPEDWQPTLAKITGRQAPSMESLHRSHPQ